MPYEILWGIRPNFFGLSPCVRQVAYALRTRPPVATIKSKLFNVLPLDLHVLGLPLAFILSQDQTLHCKKMFCYKSLALISKVLFEITLLQEWKKLLAAQILQRTLFNILL